MSNPLKNPKKQGSDFMQSLFEIFSSDTRPYRKKNYDFFNFLVSKIQKCESLLEKHHSSEIESKLEKIHENLNATLDSYFTIEKTETSCDDNVSMETQNDKKDEENAFSDKQTTSKEGKSAKTLKKESLENLEKIYKNKKYECKNDGQLRKILFEIGCTEAKVTVGKTDFKVFGF